MIDRMRILFLHSSMNAGGAERTIATLANEMVLLGHSVAIATRRAGVDHYELDERVTRYRPSSHRSALSGLTARVQNAVSRERHLSRVVHEFRPDVTVTFGMSALASALLSRLSAPIGLIIHSERSNPYVSHSKMIWRLIARPLAGLANGTIFQTEGARGYFSRRLQIQSAIIKNPIVMPSTSVNLVVDHSRRQPRVVVVGRLVPQKRVDFILKAFADFHADHPRYTLEVIGDGPERERLEQISRRIGDGHAVRFLGVRPDTYEHLTNARFYILASAHEGMPNSLMEAMAAGLTCFAGDCDFGPRSLIQEGVNGWLFPLQDASALVRLMNFEASDLAHSSEVGQRARLLATSNSPASITQKYLAYFKEIECRSTVSSKISTSK